MLNLYGLKASLLIQRLLKSGNYPTEAEQLQGIAPEYWYGTGATVNYPYFSLSNSSATNFNIRSNPCLFTLLSSSNWNNTVLQLKNTSDNGYQISFPTADSVSVVTLSRLDSGSETVLETFSFERELTANDWLTLDWCIFDGGIKIILEGECIIHSDDTTYRLTDWKYTKPATYTLKLRACHYLVAHTELWEYRVNLLDKDLWSSGAKMDGSITLASGYNCFYTGIIFPKDKYAVKCTFDENNVPLGHKSQWGIVTSALHCGVYVEFNTKAYLKDISGSKLTVGPNADTQTSIIRANVNSDGYIRLVNGAGEVLCSADQTAKLALNSILHFKDISANANITLFKIEASPDDTTFGFMTHTLGAVNESNTSNTDIIMPY